MTSPLVRSENRTEDRELYIVAPVVPDLPEFRNAAFSRAGNMYITNVVSSLAEAGLPAEEVISFLPLPVFPRSSRMFIRGYNTFIGATPLRLLPFVNLPILKQFTIGLGVLVALLRRARQSTGVGAIYCYNAGLPHGPAVLFAARLSRFKAIVSLNDVLEPGQLVPASLWRRLNYWLERQLIPRFDGHIAVSDQIMTDLAPNRGYIRLEGAISDEALSRLETREAADTDRFTIVFAGGLDRANGVIEMLAAFQLLTSARFRLRIAGDGPLASHVEAAARNDTRIEYLGQLDFNAVLEVYRRADVLINMRLTSAINTRYFYPSKMMEFLASGVPVISTCTGHTEREFGAFVYLLRDESPDALAALIERVSNVDLAERKAVGDTARDYMRRHKTWRAAGDRLAAYISTVITQA